MAVLLPALPPPLQVIPQARVSLFFLSAVTCHCRLSSDIFACAAVVTFDRKDRMAVGSKAIVCQDADLRGEISIGAGMVTSFHDEH